MVVCKVPGQVPIHPSQCKPERGLIFRITFPDICPLSRMPITVSGGADRDIIIKESAGFCKKKGPGRGLSQGN
ncbi:MAG: hypothetical protein CSH36_05485 [Thalassolituus sp.]|nr:MAG: hypothetical protein CSH36_05485 [Thalassolituus sp.]